MKNLRFKKKLELGMHHIQVFHPTRDIPYPDSASTYFCTGFEVRRQDIGQYPSDARLFVDGVCEGKLINVFEE